VKKSHASMVLACVRQNSRQVGPVRPGAGSRPALRRSSRPWLVKHDAQDRPAPRVSDGAPQSDCPAEPNNQSPDRARDRWSPRHRTCGSLGQSSAERPAHDANPDAPPDSRSDPPKHTAATPRDSAADKQPIPTLQQRPTDPAPQRHHLVPHSAVHWRGCKLVRYGGGSVAASLPRWSFQHTAQVVAALAIGIVVGPKNA